LVIVVEGFDNSGKSTLVRKLSNYLPNHRMAHSPGPLGFWLFDWVSDEFRRMTKSPRVIYDRFPLISEMVFGPILRGKTVFPDYVWRFYWNSLLTFDPFLIYTRPTDDHLILDTLGARPQMDGVTAHAPALLQAYDRFFRELPLTSERGFGNHEAYLYTYDYTTDPEADRLIRVIKNVGDQLGIVE